MRAPVVPDAPGFCRGTLLLRGYLADRGISGAELGTRCGFRKPAVVYGWVRGLYTPTPRNRVKLQAVTGIDPSAWDPPEGKRKKKRTPRVSEVAGCDGSPGCEVMTPT